jgi:ABC-type nickel/cobalt efflux system permease component RcnA
MASFSLWVLASNRRAHLSSLLADAHISTHTHTRTHARTHAHTHTHDAHVLSNVQVLRFYNYQSLVHICCTCRHCTGEHVQARYLRMGTYVGLWE